MGEGIRRQFVDVAEGQVHYRYCGDRSHPPLVMLHGSPSSSYSVMGLMRQMASDRFVIAPDIPGNGDSSPAPMSNPDIACLADIVLRALDAIGLKRFDIYGWHTGGTLCIELSVRHAQRLRRIVLDGISVFDASEREMLLGDNRQAPDLAYDYDGTQFIRAWTMVRDAHLFYPWWDRGAGRRRPLGLPSPEYLHGEVLEVLKACRTYFHSYRASMGYPKRQQLPKIANPTLVTVCPADQLYDHLDTVASLVRGARKAVYPDTTDAGFAKLAAIMREFLDDPSLG